MYEKVEKCPLCGGKEQKNVLIAKDHTATNESFAIVACGNCGFHFTSPRPTANNLSRYYESSAYISHADKPKSIVDWIYFIVRKYTLKSKVRLIKNLVGDNKSIIDFGCGTGDFIEACEEKNLMVYGVEPNPRAREIAAEKVKTEIFSDVKNIQLDKKVDVITLWHVLEHIPTLEKTMDTLVKSLKNKGFIVIAVPNKNSYDAQKYGTYWAAYDVPRHLYHFTRADIQRLAKNHKLKVKIVKPQYFDAFYVSYLSEKYQGKSYPLFRGIITGMKSNLAAAKDKKEYSSLIYILKK